MLNDSNKQFLALALKCISFSSLFVGFFGILDGFHPVTSDSPYTQINRLKVASHSSLIIKEVSVVKVRRPRGIHLNHSK